MESDMNKIEPAHGLSVPLNFLFLFEDVIRNPDNKELKYFQLCFVRRCGAMSVFVCAYDTCVYDMCI